MPAKFAFYTQTKNSTLDNASIGSGSIQTYHLSAGAITPAKADLTQTWDFSSGSTLVSTPTSSSQATPRSYVLASISESIGNGSVGLSIIGSSITTTNTVDAIIAGGIFTPTSYSLANRTTQLKFEAIGQVVSGVLGTLTLFNVTDGTSVGSLNWTEVTGTYKSLSITPVPSSSKIYEVRAKKTSGSLNDYALFYGINLGVSWG